MHRDLLEHILATSDPALRAVVAEDAAALVGLLVASGGLVTSELTKSSVPDAIASILIGEEVDPRLRRAALRELLANPAVARVTYLRLEIVGPRAVLIIGDVDLTGDDVESLLSVRLRALESTIRAPPAVAGAVLSLSAPDEPSLLL